MTTSSCTVGPGPVLVSVTEPLRKHPPSGSWNVPEIATLLPTRIVDFEATASIEVDNSSVPVSWR